MPSHVLSSSPLRCVAGTVQQVDWHDRTITLESGASPREFSIPTFCRVHLRGEPVSLHLLQPWDRVSVRFSDSPRGAVAQIIDIDYAGLQPA